MNAKKVWNCQFYSLNFKKNLFPLLWIEWNCGCVNDLMTHLEAPWFYCRPRLPSLWTKKQRHRISRPHDCCPPHEEPDIEDYSRFNWFNTSEYLELIQLKLLLLGLLPLLLLALGAHGQARHGGTSTESEKILKIFGKSHRNIIYLSCR